MLPTVTHSITLTCHTSSTVRERNLGATNIIMATIDSHTEALIDKGLDAKIEITKGKTVIVSPSKVLTYGDVDFDNDDDLDLFDRLNLKVDPFSGFAIPVDYDYETHSHLKGKTGPKFFQTWDNIKIIKFKHASLGKPKKIIIFKH